LAGKIGAHSRLGVEETKKLASFLGKEGGEITEEMVIDMVPDFGEGDFFEASEAFFSGKLDWAMEAIDRHFFQGKDARPLLATLQNRNRLLIQLRVLVDGKELDPKQRLGKDQLEQIGRKYQDHFSDPSEKTTLNLFSQNPWFLGRLLPLVQKFSTRRLIDLQSNLITAFEQVLGQPKEQHATIFKNLVIRTNSLAR
jgi:DNA polymerase-3 subunit delta